MLKTPLPLLPLVLDGLKQRRQHQQQQQRTRLKAGRASAAVDVPEAEAKDMVELLLSKAEMMDEYFAVRLSAGTSGGLDAQASTGTAAAGSEVSPSGLLYTLPVLVEQYEPYWCGTPSCRFPSRLFPCLQSCLQIIVFSAMLARCELISS